MSDSEVPGWLEVVYKILSLVPTAGAVLEGWMTRALPMAAELRPRAAFLSIILAIFGLLWVWHKQLAPKSKSAWFWLGSAVTMFLVYLTLWDQFAVPPVTRFAYQALRHALVLSYALSFLGFSVAFGLLAKAAVTNSNSEIPPGTPLSGGSAGPQPGLS